MANHGWTILLPAVFALALGGQADAAELRVQFPGLKPRGQIAYAVYADPASWASRSGAVRSGMLEIGQDLLLTLPPGDYGVMAYHDEDGDRKLDTLPIGLPTEPYGFSNDARGVFGPPTWRAARFKLGDGGVRQTLRLR